MEKYRNFSLFIILIPPPDFPYFYYMLGENLGSLLYGNVSVMCKIFCGQCFVFLSFFSIYIFCFVVAIYLT